jgi:hypothetical protein
MLNQHHESRMSFVFPPRGDYTGLTGALENGPPSPAARPELVAIGVIAFNTMSCGVSTEGRADARFKRIPTQT